MSTTQSRPSRPSRAPARSRATGGSGLFRAFWRWHFYASFVVVPVLLVLSVTGLIYLFRFQIEPLVQPELHQVEKPADMDFTQPYAAQLGAAQRAYPEAQIGAMAEPRADDRATVFNAVLPDGQPLDIFVNPWGAEVLGAQNPDTTISGTAVRLHADLMAGTVGDRVMELGACWAIVMAITGYYLFFKGRRARARQRKATGRSLRSRHAAIGSVVGVGLLTLLISGLPWTGFWGERVQAIATAQGSSLWSQDHGALSDPASTLDESLPHSHAEREVSWAQQEREVPTSDPDAHGGDSVASLDTAVAVGEAEGLRHPMTVAIPSDEDGVFSVIGYAFDAPTDERTVHVDQYGGQVVSSYGFDDYSTLAKTVAMGIGIHEGRAFGLWTFWGAALMCVLVIASCVTGPLMWWRRRTGGSIGAPRGRMPLRGSRWLLAGVVVLGVVLPFVGLSLLLVLALDQLVLRRVPALASWFNTA